MVAQSGREAMRLLETEDFDLAILDLMMPGIDGFQVCRWIRSQERTRFLPVIVVTFLDAVKDRVDAVKAGADYFITKPPNEAELLARIQALIRLKRQREELLRLQQDFTSMIVHDLKNPLTAILGNLETVTSGMLGSINEAQNEALSDALDQGKKLIRLVNDILDLSKIEAGRLDIQLAQVKSSNLLEAARKLTDKYRGKHDIKVEFQADDPDIMVKADAEMIEQVFSNLIDNAFKFTPQGGEIAIGQIVQENRVIFWVRDTGCGIDARDHQLIFEKYAHAQESARSKRGTGLGLVISRLIIQAHQGEIWLESAPGQGSTFYFSLPIDL